MRTSKDVEVIVPSEQDIPFSRPEIEKLLDRDILAKEKVLEEAQDRRRNFDRWFGKWFADVEAPTEKA